MPVVVLNGWMAADAKPCVDEAHHDHPEKEERAVTGARGRSLVMPLSRLLVVGTTPN